MKRRLLLLTTGLVGSAVVVNAAATQFVAWRLQYHPALGTPWTGHIYAPWAWLSWMGEPWAAGVSATFAMVQGGILSMAALGIIVVALAKNRGRRRPVQHSDVHGTARFMTADELQASGLLNGDGLYVGGWRDASGVLRYLRHGGPEHLITIAPTRSGKGVSVLLPNLLSWKGSAIINDIKGELWQMTAGWRSAEGGNICLRWEPGAVAGSAGFNFLEEVRLNKIEEVGDAMNIAMAICDPKGAGLEGKHWEQASYALFTGLILYVLYEAEARGKVGSLADLARMLQDPAREADEFWTMMRDHWHPTVSRAGRAQLNRPVKERGSVLSTADLLLTLFTDPIIERNTRHSDFKLIELMNHEKPLSFYIVTPGANKDRLRPLVRLFLTMARSRLTGVPLLYKNGQAVSPHKHRLVAFIDELASLKHMEPIESGLAEDAGWGIRYLLAVQTQAQLFEAYGQNQSITGNCQIRLILPPNEIKTAEWISESIGSTTVVKEDVTESGKRMGALGQVSRAYHEVKRPVLTPDEILTLRRAEKDEDGMIVSGGETVIFGAGRHPVLGEQIVYFMDPTFDRRSKIMPPQSQSPARTAAIGRYSA